MPGRIDRRRFLQMASTSAFAATGLPALGATGPFDVQVLIFGAGMSGISTAFWLRQFGISSLVLEARNRLGGRVWTSKQWPDAIVDLGGAYIHGSLTNPLTPLSEVFNVATVDNDFLDVQMSGTDGKVLDDTTATTIVAEFAALTLQIEVIRATLAEQGSRDHPVSDAFEGVLASLQLPPEEQAGVRTLGDSSYRTHGAELNKQSLYYVNDNQNNFAQLDRAFPKGFGELIEKLGGGQKVIFGCTVKQIVYNNSGVGVVTNQGIFTAPYAVVTLPLGVLQNSSPGVMFIPPLPPWKRDAINRLQMGVVNKLIFRFPSAFWSNHIIFTRNSPQPSSQFATWFNAQPVNGQPVFGCLVGGDIGRQTETLTDSQVLAQALAALRQWFGAQNIQVPDPVGFQRTTWLADPFSQGSYSFVPVGATSADYDFMSLPVPFYPNLPMLGRIFFAGEATHRTFPGSVAGAYESGLREAFRLFQILNPAAAMQATATAAKVLAAASKGAPVRPSPLHPLNAVRVWSNYVAGVRSTLQRLRSR